MQSLTTEQFERRVLTPDRVALVAFTADWCRPSLLQKPIVAALAADFGTRAVVALVDVDQEEALADRFEVRTLPTVILFAKGEIVEALAGFQPDDFLRSYLEFLLDQMKSP
jgi:thioredoxin-like negative regulator of GroEL